MAESPSELQAEVEKLERKHAENPEGRYFVPLANDYRKMGELERAEALLRAGLQKHPDYLSAHIVLGRCLADRGATSEAADEFTYVLSMDPQNLIALRSLGELAVAEGRRDDAGRWYRELLAVDPMNEDARRALEQLDAPEEVAPEPDSTGAGAWWEAGAEAGSETATPVAESEELVRAADDRPRPDSYSEAASNEDSFGEFLNIDLTAEADLPAGDEQPEYGMMELNAGAESGGGRAERENESGYEGGYEDPGADDIEPVEVVTETIAELYARQGLHDRAADVYRELIRRRGGDPSLERRLEELERSTAAADRAEADPFAASFVEGFGDEAPSGPDEPATAAAGETAEQGADAGLWEPDPEEQPEEEAALPSWSPAGEEPADRPSAGDQSSPIAAEPWAAAAEEPVEQERPGAWAPASEASADEDAAEPRAAPAPAQEGARTAGRTIGGYLSALAAWTPGAEPETEPVQLGEQEVTEIESSPSSEALVSDAQPADPFPWEVPGEEATPAASGDAAAEESTRDTAPDPGAFVEPWAGGSAEPDGSPALEPRAGEELPGTSDLEPEPSIELEDYFPADEADSAAEPKEPASPPPASGGGTSSAEEDDDLESFQAWLRSLKR